MTTRDYEDRCYPADSVYNNPLSDYLRAGAAALCFDAFNSGKRPAKHLSQGETWERTVRTIHALQDVRRAKGEYQAALAEAAACGYTPRAMLRLGV